MAEDSQQLKERLIKLSDEQLIEIVLAAPGEYRQEAIDIAKTELKWRNVEIPRPEETEEAVETGVAVLAPVGVAALVLGSWAVPVAAAIAGAMKSGAGSRLRASALGGVAVARTIASTPLP